MHTSRPHHARLIAVILMFSMLMTPTGWSAAQDEWDSNAPGVTVTDPNVWGNPGVVVTDPMHANALPQRCTVVQTCYPNGECIERQVCD